MTLDDSNIMNPPNRVFDNFLEFFVSTLYLNQMINFGWIRLKGGDGLYLEKKDLSIILS